MAFGLKKKKYEVKDLDLMAFMNLFSILIPFLLSVAVFQKLGVLEINMPERSIDVSAPSDVNPENLNLTIIITDKYVTIGANGGFMPNYYYETLEEYRSISDANLFTVPYQKGRVVKSPTDGRVMTQKEKERFLLNYLVKKDSADPGKTIIVAHNSAGDALLDTTGNWYTQPLAAGQPFRTVGFERVRYLNQHEAATQIMAPVSVFNEVAKVLWQIHLASTKRESVPEDIDKVIILASPTAIYDKVIHAMDAAKFSGFTQIALSLLGG